MMMERSMSTVMQTFVVVLACLLPLPQLSRASAADQLIASLNHLHEEVAKVGSGTEDVQKHISSARENGIDISNSADASTIAEAFAAAGASMSKLASSKPEVVATGALEMVSALAPMVSFLGPAGAVVGGGTSVVASIITGLIGIFGKQGPTINQVLQKIVDKAFADERIRNLENGVQGLKDVFMNSKAFLDGARNSGHNITDSEVAAISCHCPIYSAVAFMGTLGSEIGRMCGPVYDVNNPPDNLNSNGLTCLRMVEMYASLAVLQDLFYFDMFLLVYASGHSHSVANGILESRKQRLQHAVHLLEFLYHPENRHAVAASIFRKSVSHQMTSNETFVIDAAAVRAFLSLAGLDAGEMDENCDLSSWPMMYMTPESDLNSRVWAVLTRRYLGFPKAYIYYVGMVIRDTMQIVFAYDRFYFERIEGLKWRIRFPAINTSINTWKYVVVAGNERYGIGESTYECSSELCGEFIITKMKRAENDTRDRYAISAWNRPELFFFDGGDLDARKGHSGSTANFYITPEQLA